MMRLSRSSRLVILVAAAILLLTPGCALVNLIVQLPTPTPPPERALRPTFTPTVPSDQPTAAELPQPAPDQEQPSMAEVVEQPPQPSEPVAETAAQAEEAVAPLEEVTVEPPTPTAEIPTPTPTPYVVVAADQPVAVRAGPGPAFDPIGELVPGQELSLVARNEDGTWWQVCCVDGQEAWVSAELVAPQGATEQVALAANIPPTPTPSPTPVPKPEIVVLNPRVNIRSGPSTDFDIVGQAEEGSRLEVVGRNQDSNWWQVCCVNGQEGWITADLVRTEGPIEQVALAANLPTATPRPTPTVAAVAASATTTPTLTVEPDAGTFAFELTETTTFPFSGNDYFRVAAKVRDEENNPLGNSYLRIVNETTGQQWLSSQSGDYAWEYSAPSADFGDFREINIQFDTNGQSPLDSNAFAVWLVDGSGRQISPAVRYPQNGDEFQWLYVVYTLR